MRINFPKISGKEKAHKHKQNFLVIAWVGGGVSRPGGQGSPDRWPGVKSLCAVCGTQGTYTFSSRCPAGRIGDRGHREINLCAKCLCAFSGPYNCRYRYRLETRMNSFDYHYRSHLGVRSHPFIAIDSQLPSWKSFEVTFHKLPLPLPLPSWNAFELIRKKGNHFEYDGISYWCFSLSCIIGRIIFNEMPWSPQRSAEWAWVASEKEVFWKRSRLPLKTFSALIN